MWRGRSQHFNAVMEQSLQYRSVLFGAGDGGKREQASSVSTPNGVKSTAGKVYYYVQYVRRKEC